MKQNRSILYATALVASVTFLGMSAPAQAQTQKPNIILILSDDFGYGDAGAYGGGPARGSPTPSIDRLAAEGMTFFPTMPSQAARQAGLLCRQDASPTAVA
jgi:Sulfatase